MKYEKWTEDKIVEESRKYAGKRRSDFRNGSPKAYRAAIRIGILDNLTWLSKRRRDYWTEQHVFEESHKYEGLGKSAFKKGSSGAFEVAQRNGWLKRMPWLGEAHRHNWTWDELVKVSLKYAGQGRMSFCRGNEKAYRYALRKNLLNKLTWLSSKADAYTDPIWSVYAYEFSDAYYVGLTCNTALRDWQHRTNHHGRSTVHKHHIISGQPIPKMTILKDHLTREQAKVTEDEMRMALGSSTSKRCLNVAKTGRDSSSTGGVTRIWTKPRILELAKGCKRRSDLKKRSTAAYNKARRLGLLDMLFPS